MRSPSAWVLLGVLLVAPSAAVGQSATEPRSAALARTASGRPEVVSFERRLEDAVGRVSVPHAGILLGRAHASRGYRLPGYGIVFVLTPRSLPGEEPVFVVRHHPGPGGTGIHVVSPGLARGGGPPPPPESVEELERKVLVLQHAAEARRREAEEDMDRIVQDFRVRLALEGGEGSGSSREHDVTAPVDSPSPSEDSFVEQEMEEPPWKFWLRVETDEERRSPDRIVEDVRSAVIGALDARAGAAAGLSGEEFVTVAVDFVPGDLFASHREPSRTLIVRARQRDLEAHARGKIALDELRERVEVIEY